MTYYERITYLLGEYNQLSCYLYSNSVKLLTTIEEEKIVDKDNLIESLSKIDFDSFKKYNEFIKLSLYEKKKFFFLLPTKIQNKLDKSLDELSYLNNLFFITYDNGFASEDITIYQKAIDELTFKISNITSLNLEITNQLKKIESRIKCS